MSPEEALRETMHKFRLSGIEMAKRSGVSATQISSYQSDSRKISVQNLIKIVNALSPEAKEYYLFLVFGIEKLKSKELSSSVS